jgi:hypothetical protein
MIRFLILDETKIRLIGNRKLVTEVIHNDGVNQETLDFLKPVMELKDTSVTDKSVLNVTLIDSRQVECFKEGRFFVLPFMVDVERDLIEKERKKDVIAQFSDDELLDEASKRKIKTPISEYTNKEIEDEDKKRKKK